MGALFSNMRIRSKVLSGFGITIAVSIGLAVFMLIQLRNETEAFDSFGRASGNAVTGRELEASITDTRLQVNRFIASGSREQLERAQKAAEDDLKVIERLSRGVTNPERSAVVKDVARLHEQYRQAFGKLAPLVLRVDELFETVMNPTGAAARKALSEIADTAFADGDVAAAALAGQAQESLQLARVHVVKFGDSGAAESAKLAREEFAELGGHLKKLTAVLKNPRRQELAAEVSRLVPVYVKGFEDLAVTLQQRDKLRAEALDATGRQIGEKLELLGQSVTKFMTQTFDDATAAAHSAEVWAISLSVLASVLSALLAWTIGTGIARPIVSMTSTMGRLAEGDKTVEVPGVGRGDEIGAMAAAVQVFKDTAIEAERMAAEEKAAQAERERRAAKVDELTRGFDKSVSTVLGAVSSATTELQATAGSMSATAEETSRQSVAVAAASEQASTNVQTVASAAEELSSSIAEISRQVQQSAQVAGKAAEDAARTNGTVQTLAEAAQKIGDVVDLINDIASQTNLLALNATIEAARAGEAGKGFAVVASEVKSLANQTAKATEEIGAQISAMQSVTGEAVSAINAIGSTIGEINQIATAIASAVEEQGAATQEIARNVQQAAAGTQEVSSNIAGVQQAATDTGAASQQVLGASGELAQQAEMLRAQVDEFLASVKAA